MNETQTQFKIGFFLILFDSVTFPEGFRHFSDLVFKKTKIFLVLLVRLAKGEIGFFGFFLFLLEIIRLTIRLLQRLLQKTIFFR